MDQIAAVYSVSCNLQTPNYMKDIKRLLLSKAYVLNSLIFQTDTQDDGGIPGVLPTTTTTTTTF